jgi:hypothetical protein
VLFDRICRENGIAHRLTKPRSPTTTGKVERWHQSIQNELLADAGPFDTIADAQAAVDAWRESYNRDRPHQSLDMAFPAERFATRPQADPLPIWTPPQLRVVPSDPASSAPEAAPVVVPVVDGGRQLDAVEVDRVVPASGNLTVGPQQFWFGPQRAGQEVTLWIDTTTVHLAVEGRHLKTLPSRLSTRDLSRLRAAGARPAGPPPARPALGVLAAGGPVEIDRTVNRTGVVVIAGAQLSVGMPLAGQRATIRLDEHTAHVVVDGQLWRSIPFTLPAGKRARLQGARQPRPLPPPRTNPVRVGRRVSSQGAIQVINQRIHVGKTHAGRAVTVEIDEHLLRVLDDQGQVLTVAPRTNPAEPNRHKVYGRARS